MAAQKNVIQLHQTLHGYADGHRLLAGSLRLPTKAAHLLATLSDLSGPELIPGFESYLTGYPVNELKKYALARTWYAREMRRPGCVWTHTILIDWPDLAQLENLLNLLPCFVRPQPDEPDWRASYEKPVLLSNTGFPSPEIHDEIFEVAAKPMMLALYAEPEKSVGLFVDQAKSLEWLVLTVWNQQWPRLRREFSFCTGALSWREAGDRRFDLQLAPTVVRNQFERVAWKQKGILLLDEIDKLTVAKNDESAEGWLQTAVADLHKSNNSELRGFLWRLGLYAVNGRRAFAGLVKLFDRTQDIKQKTSGRLLNQPQLELLLQTIATTYPKPSEEVFLKQALFGEAQVNLAAWLPSITEAQLLRLLTTTASSQAFDASSLSVQERAEKLIQAEPQAAIDLACEVYGMVQADNRLAVNYLRGVAEKIEVSRLAELSDTQPKVVTALIEYRPEWLHEAAFWKELVGLKRTDFIAGLLASLESQHLQPIAPMLLELENDELTKAISERISSQSLVTAILQWFNQTAPTNFTPQTFWFRFLHQHRWKLTAAAEQLGWQTLRPVTLWLLSLLLNPHDHGTVALDSAVWNPLLAEKQFSDGQETLWLRSRAFLLALGFHNPHPSGAALVAGSFSQIYRAAKDERLSWEAWALLEQQVPSGWFMWDWDRCRRLSCALVDYFVQYHWSDEYLIAAIDGPDMCAQLFACSDETSRGRRFWRDLVDRISHDETKVINWKRQWFIHSRERDEWND